MRLFNVIGLLIACILNTQIVQAEFDGELISSIEFVRLDRVTEQRVQNLIQSAVGLPFYEDIVEEDVHMLTSLGEFAQIKAERVLQEDGTVHLIFTFTEQQIVSQVSVVGNTLLSDKELLAVVPIVSGLGKDDDAIDRGRRAIMDLYKEQGNYLVEVFSEIVVYNKQPTDEVTGLPIQESVALIYRVMEGPRVRVKSIRFEGNYSFSDKELSAETDSGTAIPFLKRGELNESVLNSDAQKILRFYTNRGYRDARVSFSDELSPDDKEAQVVFVIEEGPQYILGGLTAQINTSGNLEPVFTDEQIAGLISMKVGDVYRQIDVYDAVDIINKAYGVLGRIVEVDPKQEIMDRAMKNLYGGGGSIEQEIVNVLPYHAKPGVQINIIFMINEGIPTKVGLVEIKGNSVTKDNVIRGRIGLKPGYPFDVQEADRSRDRLMRSQLFNSVKMTIQPEDSKNPGYRDLLVEVEERQTGTLNFGLMAGSDSGLLGNISMSQSNFDIADWPETWSEFWQRKSFIGAGQKFSMEFQPGDKIFNYGIGLTDPRFLDTDYSVGGRAGYMRRQYVDYTQETFSSNISVGRKFGDIWSGNVNFSLKRIELTDINDDVPVEIFNDRGPSTINSLGISATRDTLEPWARPNKGSRLAMKVDQFGVPSGDYSFTKSFMSYTTYFATNRDFLNRVSTLRLDAKLGYIFNGDSPTFERFYLGGRSMRGFEFRTISPKGTPRVAGGSTDVSIGGDWELFLGAQYEFPILDRFISMVFFCDSGTVTESPSLDDYRVSVGTGIRLNIPQLGQAPLAFDFGFPVVKQEDDRKKTFSFSVQLPF
jgi:outer membrane protein insertion porin family